MSDTTEGLKTKVCKTCGADKPTSEFPYISTRNRHDSHCKICRNKRNVDYVKSRGEEFAQKKRDYANNHFKNNREAGLKYRKERYLTYNREEQLEKRRKWYRDNKEKHAANRTKYELENKDRLRLARRKWENSRLKNDINYKLHKSLAGRVRFELKGVAKRTSRTEELIGCTISELKIFIENQFLEGMNWSNWETNGWHIDHRIPVSWFNLENEHCRKLAFNYKNLQPLWGEDNLKKKNFYSHKMAV